MIKKIRIFVLMMVMCVLTQGALCMAATHSTTVTISTAGQSYYVGGTYGKMTAIYEKNTAMTDIKNESGTQRYLSASASEYKNGQYTYVIKSNAGVRNSGIDLKTDALTRKSGSEYSYACRAAIYNSVSSSTGVAENFECIGYQN